MSKPVIGLAGGIGAGKSAVARILREFGAGLIDSDRFGHAEINDPDVVRTLTQWWGATVLAHDGRIDRDAVGKIVFDDATQRGRLESLLHPRIARRSRELTDRFQADPKVRFIVIDAPLLFEVGIDADCDCVLFVHADRAIRTRRLRQDRGWSDRALKKREEMQIPLDIKRRRADHLVVNNSTLNALHGQVAHLVNRILALANKD